MHDTQYRTAIAWQNVGYNQPPHPSFFIGDGMAGWHLPNVWHQDTGKPAFFKLAASKSQLWPPDNQLEEVTIEAELVDLLDHWPFARIVSVTSNEPEPLPPHAADIVIVDDLTVQLRASRDPQGTGRVYTIEVEGFDRSGNTAVKSVQVEVPRHQP